jgi:hypothetical protein
MPAGICGEIGVTVTDGSNGVILVGRRVDFDEGIGDGLAWGLNTTLNVGFIVGYLESGLEIGLEV